MKVSELMNVLKKLDGEAELAISINSEDIRSDGVVPIGVQVEIQYDCEMPELADSVFLRFYSHT